ELMVHLFDLEPTGGEVPPPDREWQPEQPPSDVELVARALATNATQPLRLARTAVRTARAVGRVAGVMRRPGASPTTMPLGAPSTMFNASITPHRRVAFGRSSLDDMKLVKKTFGTTINDVVLAACTTSLRQWLDAHGG